VAHELYYGAFKSQRKTRNVDLVDALQFEVLEFDQDDAKQAGEVRALLAARGTPIGPYDVLIAGQARARKLILVTRNTGEFARVPDLRVEDWESVRGKKR
ncbi:MAG TPA: PIN domain-containing protein, partial [Thermoanaerobaculia bacterium]|nr:PIN domain-containing protein [Thermoanaerobaculia bacterium]